MASLVPASSTIPAAITFDPSLAVTASITSINPTSGFVGTVVVIVGVGLRTTPGSVTIGGAACVVSTWNNTAITCTVGNSAAGALAWWCVGFEERC
jgi:hypothetical protein